ILQSPPLTLREILPPHLGATEIDRSERCVGSEIADRHINLMPSLAVTSDAEAIRSQIDLDRHRLKRIAKSIRRFNPCAFGHCDSFDLFSILSMLAVSTFVVVLARFCIYVPSEVSAPITMPPSRVLSCLVSA